MKIFAFCFLFIPLYPQGSPGIAERGWKGAAQPSPSPAPARPNPPKPVYQPPAQQSGAAAYERLRQIQEANRRQLEQQTRRNFERSRSAASASDPALGNAMNQYQQLWNSMSAQERDEMRRSGVLSPADLRRMLAEDGAQSAPGAAPNDPGLFKDAPPGTLNDLGKVEEALQQIEKTGACPPDVKARIAELSRKRDAYAGALRDIEGAYKDAQANAGAGQSLLQSSNAVAGLSLITNVSSTFNELAGAALSVYLPKQLHSPSQGLLNATKKIREVVDDANAAAAGGTGAAKALVNQTSKLLPLKREDRNAIKNIGGSLLDAAGNLRDGNAGAAAGDLSQGAAAALKYAGDANAGNAVAGAGKVTQAIENGLQGNAIQGGSNLISGVAKSALAILPNNKRLEALETASSATAAYDKNLKATGDRLLRDRDDAGELDKTINSSLRSIAQKRDEVAGKLRDVESQLIALQSSCPTLTLH